LGDDSRERHGVVEPQTKLFVFRVPDNEDGFLDLLPTLTGQDIEILDCRRDQGHETIEFVNAANDVDHRLAGQGVFRQKISETP